MTEEALYQISRSIVSEIGPMLTSRPYIALIDKFGKIQYLDEAVEGAPSSSRGAAMDAWVVQDLQQLE